MLYVTCLWTEKVNENHCFTAISLDFPSILGKTLAVFFYLFLAHSTNIENNHSGFVVWLVRGLSPSLNLIV